MLVTGVCLEVKPGAYLGREEGTILEPYCVPDTVFCVLDRV